MIFEVALLSVRPGRAAEFEQAFREAQRIISSMKGYVSHELRRYLTASEFGPNDEIGNLNYVTPEKTLAAAKLVTRGKAYRLGIETNKDTPTYPPRTFAITVVQPGQVAGGTLGPSRITGAVQAIVNPSAIK